MTSMIKSMSLSILIVIGAKSNSRTLNLSWGIIEGIALTSTHPWTFDYMVVKGSHPTPNFQGFGIKGQ